MSVAYITTPPAQIEAAVTLFECGWYLENVEYEQKAQDYQIYVKLLHAYTHHVESNNDLEQALLPIVLAYQQQIQTSPVLAEALNGLIKYLVDKDVHVSKKRCDKLIEQAFLGEKEYITQEDLKALALVFGQQNLQKIMLRFDLTGDGSDELPFTNNNLKVLLLGLAANMTADDVAELSPQAIAIINEVKKAFQHESGLAQSKHIRHLIDEFELGKQNKHQHQAAYQRLKQLIYAMRQYIQKRIVRLINITGSDKVEEFALDALNQINPPNVALDNLKNDLQLLQAQGVAHEFMVEKPSLKSHQAEIDQLLADLKNLTLRQFSLKHPQFRITQLSIAEMTCLQNYRSLARQGINSAEYKAALVQAQDILISNMDPWDLIADKVVSDLVDMSFAEFIKKYPAFSHDNAAMTQYDFYQLQKYADLTSKSGFMAEKTKERAQAHQFIVKKLQAIYPFARATLFSHIMGYLEGVFDPEKANQLFTLPLANGQPTQFMVKPIIHNENGLAVSMFSPIEDTVDQDTIPLCVVLQGTHDIASILRDLHPHGAGIDEFDPKHAYLNRILSAINQEIAVLTQKYPNKKVSIELFGHSLGGADSYQLLLALQEAMAQNKYRTPEGHADFLNLCDPNNKKGFLHAKEADLRTALPLALKESLGLVDREFGDGHVENRTLDPKVISHLHLDHIQNIKVHTKNAAGCHEKILAALSANAAFLGKNSDFQLFDYPLEVDGDIVIRTGHGRGLLFADPREAFFNQNIIINHCRVDKNMAGMENMVSHFLEGRLAFVEAHCAKIFQGGPGNWLKQNAKIVNNHEKQNITYLRDALMNPVTIKGVKVIDTWSYRSAMRMIRFTLTLAALLIAPLFTNSVKALEFMANLERNLCTRFGLVPPKPTKPEPKQPESKVDLLAHRKALLFKKAAYQDRKPYITPDQTEQPSKTHYHRYKK